MNKHLKYDLSVLLRQATDDGDFSLVQQLICLCYEEINEKFDIDTSTELSEVRNMSTDVRDFENDDELLNQWNDELIKLYTFCDNNSIYIPNYEDTQYK